jgi:hypothetical protein
MRKLEAILGLLWLDCLDRHVIWNRQICKLKKQVPFGKLTSSPHNTSRRSCRKPVQMSLETLHGQPQNPEYTARSASSEQFNYVIWSMSKRVLPMAHLCLVLIKVLLENTRSHVAFCKNKMSLIQDSALLTDFRVVVPPAAESEIPLSISCVLEEVLLFPASISSSQSSSITPSSLPAVQGVNGHGGMHR